MEDFEAYSKEMEKLYKRASREWAVKFVLKSLAWIAGVFIFCFIFSHIL